MEIPRLRELRAEKVSIPAFFDDDLEAIARKLGLYDDLVRGTAKCFICGKRVTLRNLGAFLKTGDGIKVVCDDSACLYKAVRIAEELSHRE